MTRPAVPPRLARWLLTVTLPAHLADDVVANLDDLHAARVFRHGVVSAGAWYWRQALWFPLRLGMAGSPIEYDVPRRRTSLMRSILQDLSYAVRLHRSRPGFTLVAVASLAVAIGFTTAIFSVVDGVLLRPAPLADFDRLMMVWETDRNTGTTREPASVPDFVDYRATARSFSSLGALIAGEANLMPPGGDPVRLAVLSVTHELLPMVGVAPIGGRAFTEEDERLGRPVVLISESLWARMFGRDPGAIGLNLLLDEVPYQIVGVVPDATDFGVLQVLSAAAYSRAFADRSRRVRVDAWLPLQPDPQALPRSTHPAFMIGRLADGVSLPQAQDEMTRLAIDLEETYPSDNTARGVNVEALSEIVFGKVRPAFLALVGAVALVLLVACVNVANLLLAQAEARRGEVAIRAALGADRRRLARQFFAETLSLTVAAAALGVGLAYGVLEWLVASAPAEVPRLTTVAIDFRVLSVTVAIAVGAGLVFGLVPTFQAGRSAPHAGLTTGGGRTAARARRRSRAILVVAELALAVMLVSGAGLLVRSFWMLQQIDPGFEPSGVVKAEYQLPASRYPVDFSVWPDFKEQHAFTRTLVERARQLPGVRSAAVAGNHPLDPGFTNSFLVVGREAEASTWPEISVRRVTSGYFDTVGLRLVRGRFIDDRDTTEGAAVAVLNEAAAERFFGDGEPLGHEIRFWGTSRRIVGIVANERFQGLTTPSPIAVYTPLPQTPGTNGAGVLLVKGDGSLTPLRVALPRLIRDIDPMLAVFAVEPLDETKAQGTSDRRFTMTLVGLFAIMALGLAGLGVHGVLSYGVAQRRREIGIRMALGALPERVRWQVVGEGLVLSGAGLAIGVAGALALSGWVRSLLYGVTPADPLTLAGVSGLLVLVAVLASYIPARAATRVDPVVALRVDR